MEASGRGDAKEKEYARGMHAESCCNAGLAWQARTARMAAALRAVWWFWSRLVTADESEFNSHRFLSSRLVLPPTVPPAVQPTRRRGCALAAWLLVGFWLVHVMHLRHAQSRPKQQAARRHTRQRTDERRGETRWKGVGQCGVHVCSRRVRSMCAYRRPCLTQSSASLVLIPRQIDSNLPVPAGG